ncbi:hypothetical protein INT45_006110 [Circinella minor]|uniref:FAD-binding FR-type domain-containing protein n=1 Tax=Circinella minor TaxID=1195481 RepID=A0A8H7S472_9FUNG|nr:hypothetical protein INT45_006110 [Circinella minor]
MKIPHDRFIKTSDFNKAAYSYALFCWSLFFGYCIIYQINRIVLYQTRKRRIQDAKKEDNDTINNMNNGINNNNNNNNNTKYTILFNNKNNDNNKLTLKKFYNSYVQIPWITKLIPVKHVLGITLFSITNIIFCFFAPFVLASYVTYYEVPQIALMDRRMAYIGMVNWSFVVVLGLRNNIVTKMSGMTFEALIPYHRWIARIGLVEYIPHIIYRLWWAYNKHHIWYESMTLTSEYFTGTIATLGFLFIFVTAFEYIRRNHFELFYYTHIIGYIIAMVGSLTHEISCIYYFTPAIILWVADRIYRSYQSWCVPSSLESIEPVSNNIMRIRFKYDRLKSLAPGQYVFMAFSHNRNNSIQSHQNEEEDSINKYQNHNKSHYNENRWWFLNWYPMTVAQINKKIKLDKNTLLPRISGSSVETSATVYIKALGDFTKSLYDASASGHINQFKVDGPYGPKLDTYQDHHVMACFATGVGVTPALALIQDYELQPFQEILESWLLHASSSSEIQQQDLPLHFNLSVFVTRDTYVPEEQERRMSGTKWSCGSRPDITRCMDGIEKAEKGKKVWVHTCGSDEFMRSVLNEAAHREWEAHHETFEF